jgi:putative membrane protein
MLVKSNQSGCFAVLAVWLCSGLALWITAELLPGVHITGFGRALVAALVLGFVNALVRPVLVLLTLPITVVTLGLFLFVINAATIAIAASLLDGFAIDHFGWALVAALLLSVVSGVFSRILSKKNDDE